MPYYMTSAKLRDADRPTQLLSAIPIRCADAQVELIRIGMGMPSWGIPMQVPWVTINRQEIHDNTILGNCGQYDKQAPDMEGIYYG